MAALPSLQSKAISSSSRSLSQISSSVHCATKACRLSKLRRRHDECSYGNHTNRHRRHADQQGRKRNRTLGQGFRVVAPEVGGHSGLKEGSGARSQSAPPRPRRGGQQRRAGTS
ncbi:hypothetical protein EYF80_039021 [Liparis tanakae]|uniref:Uncharacterized protein n=1 Tax=Liparis tanakae TaxID=230148 RepID=A0A4Z2GBS3_9TELE|nr:hypothetical protein EYF80_039021 [Liparis tanakae]